MQLKPKPIRRSVGHNIYIRDTLPADPSLMAEAFRGTDLEPSATNLQRHMDEVAAGTRDAVTAVLGSQPVGYGTLNWRPRYPLFRDAHIPEIQDVNVVSRARRRGVGTAILIELERRAAIRSPVVGIGVGLYRAYGSAQRLYVKRGYLPDGSGVCSGDIVIAPGTYVRLDDDLVLYLTKLVHPHGQ